RLSALLRLGVCGPLLRGLLDPADRPALWLYRPGGEHRPGLLLRRDEPRLWGDVALCGPLPSSAQSLCGLGGDRRPLDAPGADADRLGRGLWGGFSAPWGRAPEDPLARGLLLFRLSADDLRPRRHPALHEPRRRRAPGQVPARRAAGLRGQYGRRLFGLVGRGVFALSSGG